MSVNFTSSEGIRVVSCEGCGHGWPYSREGWHMAMTGALEVGEVIPLGYEVPCTESKPGITAHPAPEDKSSENPTPPRVPAA